MARPRISAKDVVVLFSGDLGEEAVPVGASNGIPVSKSQQLVADCVIANGQSISAAVDLGVHRLVGIATPATFEPTALTFQSSYDGVTWNNVYDAAGAEKSVTVGAGRRVMLAPGDFFGVRYIKARGGTAGAPTAVGAERTIKLIAEA